MELISKILKRFNIFFLYEKTALELATEIRNTDIIKLLEHKNINSGNQVTLKKKRGRPPKDKSIIDTPNKKQKKNKLNNEVQMNELENPHLKSITKHNFFYIQLPTPSHKDIISFYESNKKDDIEWENINAEQIFFYGDQKTNEDIEEKVEDQNHDFEEDQNDDFEEDQNDDFEEDQNELTDDEDDITLDNLEFFAPFKDFSTAQICISKANKNYRIIQVETNNRDLLAFKCKGKNCQYKITLEKENEGFVIKEQTHHTCSHYAIVTKKEIDEAVKKAGQTDHLNQMYLNTVCSYLNLPENAISKQRIRRAYNRMFGISRLNRIKSWGKLESFIQIIQNSGGYGRINKNQNGEINFVGFVPNYSVSFIQSSLFFHVTQMDTRFQTGLSGGRLYTIVTLTGDRSILPLGAAWAPSEHSGYTDMFLQMFGTDLSRFASCQTDESNALIKSIESEGISNQLCTWHMSKHCPNKAMFKSLVSSENSHEYAERKQRIINDFPELKKYLDINDRWSKITRFESRTPRDQNISTSCVESLNAFITRLNLKNKEPLDVFIQIYEFGFFHLKKICLQKTFFTYSVNNYLSYALVVANHLMVSKSKLEWNKYQVTKENDFDTNCTVFILPNENPTCSCKFYFDCGLPCVHMLAVASKYKMDWCAWIHDRYDPSKYQFLFQTIDVYPDFDQIIKLNNDIPQGIQTLKTRQKRIPTPGDVVPS